MYNKIIKLADKYLPQWRNSTQKEIDTYCRYLLCQALKMAGYGRVFMQNNIGLSRAQVEKSLYSYNPSLNYRVIGIRFMGLVEKCLNEHNYKAE